MAVSRRCNLCLKRSAMTADHIFPRGISPPIQRKVKEILRSLDIRNPSKPRSSLVQNGLKRSTLCANCNNYLLGQKLDPALINLYKETEIQLRNVKFLMQPILHISNIELNKVTRAVIAHFIANDETPEYKNPTIRKLRRYVLDLNSNFPAGYEFQIWLYPYREQALMKDLYHAQFGSGFDPFGISAYKSYPLAFAFGDKIVNPEFRLTGILDTTSQLDTDLNKLYNIRIDTRIQVDPNWPYAPHKNGAILTSKNSSFTAAPYMNIKKYPY